MSASRLWTWATIVGSSLGGGGPVVVVVGGSVVVVVGGSVVVVVVGAVVAVVAGAAVVGAAVAGAAVVDGEGIETVVAAPASARPVEPEESSNFPAAQAPPATSR